MTSKNSYGWVQPMTTSSRGKGGGGGGGIQDFYLGKGPGSSPNGSPGSPNFYGEDYGTGANNFSGYGNPQQSGHAQDLIDGWQSGAGLQTPANYADEGFRNMAEAYSQYYGIPLGNLKLSQQGQNFNEFANNRDFKEQTYLNRASLDLQRQGSSREDRALQAGIDQFGQNFGLQEELGRGDLANTVQRTSNDYALGNRGLDIQGQNNKWNYDLGNRGLDIQGQNNQWNYDLGRGKNSNDLLGIQGQNARYEGQTANERLGIEGQNTRYQGQTANEQYANQTDRQLGQQQNANTLLGIQGQNTRYQGQTANEQFANQTNRQLGQEQNANTRLGIEGQNARYQGQTANEQFANQTARTGVQNQYELGQGQLGFQNRQLDTTNQFNDRQLSQQADLTRENYQNQLTQSRYQAFGRASTPNQRATQSWY